MTTGTATVPGKSAKSAAAQVALSRDDVIVGSARIAREAHRSRRTILRWVRDGVLLAGKIGPFPTSPLIVRAADLERVVHF